MTTETSLEFVEKLEAFYGDNSESMSRLLRLAKTAALIEEHNIRVGSNHAWTNGFSIQGHGKDVHEAVRAVADKIKAGNHG